MKLQNFKHEIDTLIEGYIKKKLNEIPNDKDLAFLKNQIFYLEKYIKDGKRIRPYMSYLTYLSFGGKKSKEIFKTLIFLEIFHYFCLVHDDIMDKSTIRHGIKTINKKFGDSEAILLGDYLFSWAWESLFSTNLKNEQKNKIIQIFKELINEVFLGQALDVHYAGKLRISDELILKKTKHKTAGYTFIKPMLIGLILAEKYNKKNEKFCKDLGGNLGLAFQIQDDMLDITSDFNGNKVPLKDISEGTHTIFSNFVFKNGTRDQKRILQNNFGKNKTDITSLRRIFIESGALKHGDLLICKYLNNAKKITKNHKLLYELIEQLENRNT